MRIPHAHLVLVLGAAATAVSACAAVDPPARPAMPAIGALVDRVGRPLASGALANPFGTADEHAEAAVLWKAGSEAERSALVLSALAALDGLDGSCGNQLAAGAAGPDRYRPLATLLLDDRIQLDSRATTCSRVLAVEMGAAGDCGGLTPIVDEPDTMLSYLIAGTPAGVSDGVARDADGDPTLAAFPFLVAPTL